MTIDLELSNDLVENGTKNLLNEISLTLFIIGFAARKEPHIPFGYQSS